MNGTQTTLLTNLMTFAEASIPVVYVVAWTTGVVLMGMMGYRMAFGAGQQQSRPVTLGEVAARMFFAACFFVLPDLINSTATLVLGRTEDYRSALAAVPNLAGGNPFWGMVLQVAMVWTILIGAIGVYRGFLLWNSSTSPSSSRSGGDVFWQGLWHIVGGAIAINIGVFFM